MPDSINPLDSSDIDLLVPAGSSLVDEQDPSDLDPSSIVPLHQRETVYDEDRGQVFELPTGQTAKEAEYTINTQHEMVPDSNYFGMEYMGAVVADFAKGGASALVQMPSDAMEAIKTFNDVQEIPLKRGEFKLTDANLFGVIRLGRTLAGDIKPDSKSAVGEAIGEFQGKYDNWVKGLGLTPEKSPLAFEFGAAGASVLASIGLAVATRNPALIGPLFGLVEGGGMMREGREAGVDAPTRLEAGALMGTFVGVTEAIGGAFTLRHLSLNQGFKKALYESVNNAAQEAMQTAFGETVSTGYKFKNPDLVASLVEVGKASVFGAFWGGTAAGVANQFQRSSIKQDLLKEGLSEKGADQVLSKITEAAQNDPKIQEEIRDIWRHEWSPHNLSPEERAKRFAEIERELQVRSEKLQVEEEKKGPERSAAAEKVARGQALSPEEAEAYPEYLRIQLSINQLNTELAKATDPARIKQLQARKKAFLRGVTLEDTAAPSTAESAPPVASASGADRSLVAEKVARGLAITDEEAAAMPDLAAIEAELDAIDDQLETAAPEQAAELEAERAGVLAKLTFKAQKAVEEGDTGFDFGANVEQEQAVERAPASDEQVLLNLISNLGSTTRGFNAAEDATAGMAPGVMIPGSSDVNTPGFEAFQGLGLNTTKQRESDIKMLKKALAGEKLSAANQKRLQILKDALAEQLKQEEALQPAPTKERRLKQSTVDKQKATLAERVTKAATVAERKRVRAASKLQLQGEQAKAAFSKKFPDASILEKEALARSLQRQAETAKQATKAEQQRAKTESKGKAANEKAKESFNGPAEQRILESKALRRMHARMATVAREAAKWKKDDIALRLRLIKAIKRGDINGILAEDRRAIQELQDMLPGAKTVPALVDLNNRIQAIKNASKEKFNALRVLREAKHEQRLEYLLIALGYKSPEDVKKGAQTADTTQRDVAAEAKLAALTPKRWMKDLGDMFVRVFYEEHNRTFSRQVVREARYIQELEEIKKKNNVTAEELATTVEYDGITFQTQEAILIAAVQSNAEHRAAITEANKIPVETVEKVIAGLSPKMLNVAADLAAWYDNNFPSLASAVLKNSDGARDLTKVKGVYMPMFRYLDSPTAYEEDVEALMLQDFTDRNFFRRGPGTPGQLKERTAGKGGGPGRIDLRAFDLAYRYARVASSYIEMQENLQEMARLMQDGSPLRQAIENKHGKAYVKEMDEYMKRVANPGYYKDRGTMGVIARALREHASVVYIAGNLMTLVKQPLAVAFYLGNNGIGASELMGAVGKYISDPTGTTKFMLEKDPQMVNRAISREAEEQKHRMLLVNLPQTWAEKGLDKYLDLQVPLPVRQGIHKVTNFSFGALNWVQTQVDSIGWHAAYDKAKSMGKSEMAAIEAGQAAVLETQNATSPKDSARLFYSNDYLDVMQQFTDQLNKMYNILFADVPRNWKNGDRKEAMLAMLGLIMGIVLERILSEGEIPEDPEDWYKLAVTGGGSLVPILGPSATSIYMHYNGSPAAISVPATAAVDILRAGEAIADGDYEKAFQKILRPIAVTLKLPFPKSSVRRIKDIFEHLDQLGA